MSEISDVYDAIISKMVELFPNKPRIPNPYSLQDNPDRLLKDSWGVSVGDGSRTELSFCHLQLERSFEIVLTREMFTIDTKEDGFDFSVKSLLEDARTVQLEFYKLDELGIADKIDQLDISGTGPISTIFGEKYKFLSLSINITVKVSDIIS